MEVLSAIIQLLGGLAMFLYGIEVMGDGLKNSSGEALKRVLEKVTGNVLMGVLTGALVTAVIQSSTATIVLAVALIGAGVLNLKQAVSIVMGANIGTTMTAWITTLAFLESDGENWLLWLFDTDTLAPIALFAGIILIMFIKSNKTKTIGDICMGFGILFVGLMNMTGAVKGFADNPAFMNLLAGLGEKPLLGILAGLALTVIVQSSSATVAMLQTLAVTGALNFSGVYPIIMGINIGTTLVTAFYCFLGGESRDSKRTGVVHVVFNCIGTVVFMIILTIMQKLNIFGSAFWGMTVNSNIIAIFQTVFNLFTAILLIPFTNQLVKLSVMLIKDEPEHIHRHPELHTLNENLYISPAMALAEATKAVAFMGSIAKQNFARCCDALLTGDLSQTDKINSEEECLDNFADAADHFMIGLSKVVEFEADDRQVDMLLQTVPSFERIGDYGTNLLELAENLKNDGGSFSDGAKRELKLICDAVNEIISTTIDAFTNNDNELAKTVEPLEETIDDMVMILKDRHTKRLKSGNCSISSGLIFMDTLAHLERTSDHCSSIAILMLARTSDEILQNHHDYLHNLHLGADADYRAERNRRREQYIKPLNEIQ